MLLSQASQVDSLHSSADIHLDSLNAALRHNDFHRAHAVYIRVLIPLSTKSFVRSAGSICQIDQLIRQDFVYLQ